MRPQDQLLAVNGSQLAGYSHKEAADIIRVSVRVWMGVMVCEDVSVGRCECGRV